MSHFETHIYELALSLQYKYNTDARTRYKRLLSLIRLRQRLFMIYKNGPPCRVIVESGKGLKLHMPLEFIDHPLHKLLTRHIDVLASHYATKTPTDNEQKKQSKRKGRPPRNSS
jgi:hypothetical protein